MALDNIWWRHATIIIVVLTLLTVLLLPDGAGAATDDSQMITPTPMLTITLTPTSAPDAIQMVNATVNSTILSEGELITNGDFFKGLSGWTIEELYKPSAGKGEVIVESDGIRFLSKSGNNRIGIMQTLNADVSKCTELKFSAVGKADKQTVSGTGNNGREAPVAVFTRYSDVNGVSHGNLGEDPKDPMRMYWIGLYFKNPEGGSIKDWGIKTDQGEWYSGEIDLMALEPRPKMIDFIGAEGAGLAPRDGKIKSISLKCIAADNYMYVEQRTVVMNESVLVPIKIKNATNIGNMNILLSYDPTVIKAMKVQKGSLTSDTFFESNVQVAGEVRISFASAQGIKRDGSIAYISFQAIGSPGSTSPVTLVDALVNEAGTMAKLYGTFFHGEVKVLASNPKGDVNGDGMISSLDALMALKISIGAIPATAAADVNGDGKITSVDAVLILQAATGKMALS